MNRNDEWSEFLNNLASCAEKDFQATREYALQKQRKEQLDEMLTTNLVSEQKDMVDEVLFELGLAAERESELLYRQGLKDCVWLLRNLGVLA